MHYTKRNPTPVELIKECLSYKNKKEIILHEFSTSKYGFSFRYNKLSRQIRELARKVKELDVRDPFRLEATNQLLEKL